MFLLCPESFLQGRESFPLPGKFVARVQQPFPVTGKVIARVRGVFPASGKPDVRVRQAFRKYSLALMKN
ncbi:hypothetical protein [Flavobacterium sp. B17]|uniref:hypothetical protein n=1 Tax=Flavobacterium sp. B17 TaxID=95618 RepID=UPI00034575A5|nr:hypothetical protein [Flavobacterium sp. B17]